MKNKILSCALFVCCSATAFANNRQVLTCKSIDVSYRPFYTVSVFRFDLTHTGYFAVKIDKVVDFGGTKVETMIKEGPGKIQKNKFSIMFGTYFDGLFVSDGDDIVGWRLANGVLKGEMNLGNDNAVELTCLK